MADTIRCPVNRTRNYRVKLGIGKCRKWETLVSHPAFFDSGVIMNINEPRSLLNTNHKFLYALIFRDTLAGDRYSVLLRFPV